jgi:hypothetical protein
MWRISTDLWNSVFFKLRRKHSVYLLILEESDVRNILGLKKIVFLKREARIFLRNKDTVDKTQLITEFYAYHSVHRESILKKFQWDETLCSTLLFPVSRSTCFGRNPRPSSGARLNCIHNIWGWQTVLTHPRRRLDTRLLSTPDAVNTV